MPTIGEPLTGTELAALGAIDIPAEAVVVWGIDSAGEHTPRGVRPGWTAALRQLPDGKFDVHGPEATLCSQGCGRLMVADSGADLILVVQSHLSSEHGIIAGLLP